METGSLLRGLAQVVIGLDQLLTQVVELGITVQAAVQLQTGGAGTGTGDL